MKLPGNFAIAAGLVGAVLAGFCQSAAGQPPSKIDPKDEEIQRLRKRIADLEKEVRDLKGRRAVPATGRRILPVLDSLYFGPRRYSSSGPRFFVTRLLIVNLTPKALTLKQEDIKLHVGKTVYKLQDLPSQFRFSDIEIGTEQHQLNNLKMAKQLTVRPGSAASTWVVFTGLPAGKDVPELKLTLKFDRETITLDVNEFARDLLGLKVERIGPRKSLGLLTIAGRLNTVNVGSLVAGVDKLTRDNDRVLRFVIRWTDSAEQINSRMRSWLRTEAQRAGRANSSSYSYPYPDFPAVTRELHLAQVPGLSSRTTSNSSYGPPPPKRIHKTDLDAVSAALKTAYQILPRDELVEEIEHGHPLTRAAALANGGGRLPADKLPLVLKYVSDENPKLQLAAILALKDFGEKPALQKLTEIARNDDSPLNAAAVKSLASSRFPAAHRALLSILKTRTAESKRRIVKVLAAYPRAIWSETIYEFAKDPNSGVGIEALKALGIVGHPKLVDVLETSLQSKDSAIRDEAFQQLMARRDSRSEQIVLAYTLGFLKSSPPDSRMIVLLNRTKDPRAIPLLLAQLDKSSGSKSSIIDTLSRIGDQTVGAELAKRYSKMKSSYDKSQVLRALVKLKSPDFRKLAGEALMSRNSSLISAACDGLRADAGPEAVKLMISALEKSTYSSAWSYTTSSLAQIGTDEAREALERVRDTQGVNDSKRQYAVSALKSIMQRSPAYQYVYRAWQSLKQNKPKDVLALCNLALKIDGNHPWAFSSRGLAHLKLKQLQEARKDLEKALKLDPHDPYAVGGFALLLAQEAKVPEATKLLEKRREDFKSDRTFPYFAARVYALGATWTKKTAPKNDSAIREYQRKAIADLKNAVKRGSSYYNGFKPADVKSEPDFTSLHDLPDYKQLVSPTGKKKSAELEEEDRVLN